MMLLSNQPIMKTHRIAGDGIGQEVMPEGLRVLEAAASRFGFGLQFDHFDFACWPYYERHSKMLLDDLKAQMGGRGLIPIFPLEQAGFRHRLLHPSRGWPPAQLGCCK